MKLLRALYAFCFYRCEGCGKRLPKEQRCCGPECEEISADMKNFSL